MQKNNSKSLSKKIQIQEFLDRIVPPVVKCKAEHFICGNTYPESGCLVSLQTPPMNRLSASPRHPDITAANVQR